MRACFASNGLPGATSLWLFWRSLKRKGVLTSKDRSLLLAWCKSHAETPLTNWRDVVIYLDCVSFTFKKNPMQAARATCFKSWLRKSERLQLTAKGRHEHDSRSQTIKFLVGISYGKCCVLCVPYEGLTGVRFEDKVCKYLSLTDPALARVTGRTRKTLTKKQRNFHNSAPSFVLLRVGDAHCLF